LECNLEASGSFAVTGALCDEKENRKGGYTVPHWVLTAPRLGGSLVLTTAPTQRLGVAMQHAVIPPVAEEELSSTSSLKSLAPSRSATEL